MSLKKADVIAALHDLAQSHGGTLTPQAVVEAARPSSSPLHGYFDWDDSTAAAKYRLSQARGLLSVVVQYEPIGNGEERECRVFISLTTDRDGETGYRLTRTVLADADLRRQLLADAKRELRTFTEKYKTLSELAEVFIAVMHFEDEQIGRAEAGPSTAQFESGTAG